MRRFFICIVLVSSIIVFGTWIFAEKSAPNGAALWTYITKESPYTDWLSWPHHGEVRPGRAPHGSAYRLYVNERLLDSVKAPVAYGSMCVKESFDQHNRLQAITVMYKVPGFNPQEGDWLWVHYAPDGKPEQEGRVEECIACHDARADNDFIMVHEFE